MPRQKSSQSFTLVELLAVIAIISALISGVIYFTASYVQWAKLNTEQEICAVLNDELTRYKSGGGNISALTQGAPLNDIFVALQTPVVPAGMPSSLSQQFMASNYTYPGRSLSAMGSGQQYHFARVDAYTAPDFTNWYTTTTTGGSNGTIVINLTFTVVNSVPTGWDPGRAFAILNGTPGLNVLTGGTGTWPSNSVWLAEKAKTWTGSNFITSIPTNGQVLTLTLSGLTPGSYSVQLWDTNDGNPPSACTWPWNLPVTSPAITLAGGQTVTINGVWYYDSTIPANSFYGSYIVW